MDPQQTDDGAHLSLILCRRAELALRTFFSGRPPGCEGLRDRVATAVDRPTKWCAVVDRVPEIQPCAPFDEESHNIEAVGPDSLVQWRRMRMEAVRVVAARIFAGVEEHADDVRLTVLGGQRQGN